MTMDSEFDSDFYADPYPLYARWREEGGVRKVPFPGGLDGWVVTGHADGKAALNDPRLRKETANEIFLTRMDGGDSGTGGALTAHMLNSDPPAHTRLRRLVQKAFTARRVAGLRPRIEEIADALLADMEGRDEVDLVRSFALPLPLLVICELLGVPDADRVPFRAHGERMNDGDKEALFSGFRPMAVYLADLVRAKRKEPGDDLLSDLIRAQEDDDALSDQEITSMAFLLLVAGHETTVGLIANGVRTLLAHPERLAEVRDDPSLLPAAIEEFLRHDGSVNVATLRYTAEPVTIGGTEIPAGEFVHVALIAANRDPAAFPDPDRFDPGRDTGGHLAFGYGIHHCLGAPLARLEAEIAFGRLLARFPAIAASDAPEAWHHALRFRALASLPVRLRARE
ncbi:cytochrome P450 [Actinocorallia longicatena]|uniref:Cytochrome P450 n=1 Tax=Actinocorallia longicatena TaxID=111803 RepID=A0ABP6QBX1_9ACTN